MNTKLQIPLDHELRTQATLQANAMGFSSVQELVRVLLTQVAHGRLDVGFGPRTTEVATHYAGEMLDVVDDNDQVIGSKPRDQIYADGSNFRVVNAFLVNGKGELWIPRRSTTKKVFPNCLDVSMGGHVTSGEDYQLALRRELREELSLDLDQINYEDIGHLTPNKNAVSAFMHLYVVHTNKTPEYNTSDFSESSWMKPDTLLVRLAEGDQGKGDLPKLVHYLMEHGKRS